MIGKDESQFIRSEKLKGIVVTHRDYEKLLECNPDRSVIVDEACRISMANAELKAFDPECTVIVYKKMKHLDSIKTHISNIGLLTSFDLKNKVLPQIIIRIFNSINNHSDDISFYIMKIYEPDYTIAVNVPEETTIASCGERDINLAKIMKEMEFSDELSKGVDRVYRDGISFSNIFTLCVSAMFNYKNSTMSKNVDADINSI